MIVSSRKNIYKLLEQDIKIYDILIDVGCKGFYDLVDFENSKFKKLIGIDQEFERNTPFGDYRIRKTENLTFIDEEWVKYSNKLLEIFNERFEIKTTNLFDYNFGLNTKSLIICNKVLHFYDDQTKLELIEIFYKSLQKGGIIYLNINHYRNCNNTDLTKMTLIGNNTYQNKDVANDTRFLIVPSQFLKILKNRYRLLTYYTKEDDKTLTVVVTK